MRPQEAREQVVAEVVGRKRPFDIVGGFFVRVVPTSRVADEHIDARPQAHDRIGDLSHFPKRGEVGPEKLDVAIGMAATTRRSTRAPCSRFVRAESDRIHGQRA
jgi:hypothetical protein